MIQKQCSTHTHHTAVHQLSRLLITGIKEEKFVSEYWHVTNQWKNLKVILSIGKYSLSMIT